MILNHTKMPEALPSKDEEAVLGLDSSVLVGDSASTGVGVGVLGFLSGVGGGGVGVSSTGVRRLRCLAGFSVTGGEGVSCFNRALGVPSVRTSHAYYW